MSEVEVVAVVVDEERPSDSSSSMVYEYEGELYLMGINLGENWLESGNGEGRKE